MSRHSVNADSSSGNDRYGEFVQVRKSATHSIASVALYGGIRSDFGWIYRLIDRLPQLSQTTLNPAFSAAVCCARFIRIAPLASDNKR